MPRRMRHGIVFAFGERIVPEGVNREVVRDAILTTSAAAHERIFSGRQWSSRKSHGTHAFAAAFRAMDDAIRHRMWINGHQIGSINALQRRQPFYILSDDPIPSTILGLCVAFADLYAAELRVRDVFNGDEAGSWVGGDVLRSAIQTSQITAAITFYNFGSNCLKPVERAGLCHCPCLAIDGTIVAMSMPHPPPSKDNFEPQHGHKPGSWGKLLPGWHLKPDDKGMLHAHGPAAPEGGLPLPAKTTLDAECFLTNE
jgi:acyl-[acyl-carrier-protein]-phospholipid O-acyltransferase / long-chain-fatty-acid--[acyl-carrier-protein] ligase